MMYGARIVSAPTPKAQAYVRKGELVIECGLDDLKNAFLNIRASIEATNEKYQELLKQKAEKSEKKRRRDT